MSSEVGSDSSAITVSTKVYSVLWKYFRSRFERLFVLVNRDGQVPRRKSFTFCSVIELEPPGTESHPITHLRDAFHVRMVLIHARPWSQENKIFRFINNGYEGVCHPFARKIGPSRLLTLACSEVRG